MADEQRETAENDDSGAGDATATEYQPGELTPFDFSPEECYWADDLEENIVLALTDLVEKANRRDLASRRFEVEQAWEARLFDRGYQNLARGAQGGWYLPFNAKNSGVRSGAWNLKPTNIYSPNGQIIISALTRQVPKVRFQPSNPTNDGDITAAEKADDYKKVFQRDNDLAVLHTDLARYLWTDGRAAIFTRHVKDAQRFGYEDEEAPVVPEDEESPAVPEEPGQQAGPEDDAGGSGEADEAAASEVPVDSGAASGIEMQDTTGTGESEDTGENQESPGTKKPKGREVADCYGKLEVKVPMNVRDINGCDFLKLATEIDVHVAKASFPQIAKQIQPDSGPGENELDRISRINCALALSGAYGVAYVTGDAYDSYTTIDRTWFRPAAFMAIADEDVRNAVMQKFPKGALVVHAGKTFAWIRQECMDDHWTLLYASRGDGQNRAALGTWMIPIQKRVNDLVDLIFRFFVQTVPRKHYHSEAFNIEAIRQQGNDPGMCGPFTPQPGLANDQLILVEQVQQHQPELPEFIKWAINELSQLLSGAYPALAGGDTEGNDTASGIQTQRDQAMSRLGLVWHAIQAATANYHRQAVQCAARCRQGSVQESVPGQDEVIIELDDLKGDVLCFPEADSGFPESWSERQARFTAILQDSKNPFVQQLLTLPKNMKVAKDAIGLTDFDIPQTDQIDKQLGEFEILMKSGPMPNPKLVQAAQAVPQLVQQGAPPQAMEQLTQAMQQVPPQVSSVPINPDVDDSAVHADTCKEFLVSPKGRKMEHGSPEEKAAYQNILLHMKEHLAALPPPAPTGKPPSVSINYADLPPDGQAQAAAEAGIKVDPNALAQKAQADQQQEKETQLAKAKAGQSSLTIQ